MVRSEMPTLAFTLSRASGDRVGRRVRSCPSCGQAQIVPPPPVRRRSHATKRKRRSVRRSAATKCPAGPSRDRVGRGTRPPREAARCPANGAHAHAAGHTSSLHVVPTRRRLRFVHALRRFRLPMRTPRLMIASGARISWRRLFAASLCCCLSFIHSVCERVAYHKFTQISR